MTWRHSWVVGWLVLAAAWVVCPWLARAQTSPPSSPPLLVQRARIFDGRAEGLSPPSDVLMEGGVIRRISRAKLTPPASARVIDANGRVLMPGLIDAHVHLMLSDAPIAVLLNADIGYIHHVAAGAAERTLMRGFTTVRDMSGPSFGLKRAIDEGLLPGPRIYPSGAMISQTGGHSDFRPPNTPPRERTAPLSDAERQAFVMVADGVDEVRLRSREMLRLGASQIKLAVGGGVSSAYDPLDVTQYSRDEVRAAVEAAENWGTYVAVHAYTPRAIRMAVEAGVRCIEHGQLIDAATAKLLAKRGVWLSLQPFLDDEDANAFPEGSANRQKQLQVIKGTDSAYKLAKKYKINTAFGTDTLSSSRLAQRQGAKLAKLQRWYRPVEVLRMATAGNARLLALSGPRNPYPGTLGVIEEGALADLLVVQGNPLQDLSILADPERSLWLIVKDGRVVKQGGK